MAGPALVATFMALMTEQEKDARIAELEALVASLQLQLKNARATIISYQQKAIKDWKDQRDYLPYEDYDR